MKRCIDIASNALGNAAPNPMVGSVIVYNNKIIGSGYHQKCGEAHAEVNAIKSVQNKELLKHATLYVNLEPCSHYGKTPPCADLIIEKQIPRVVIACVDSFAKVAGRGIEKLRNAGTEVTVGVLKNESIELNRRFFTFHEKKRPYIILKWAQTVDRYIDAKRTKDTPIQPLWITNKMARMLVHKWRGEEQGIMVGTNTVDKDNPQLNVRSWTGNSPTRIVIDRNMRLDRSRAIFDQSVSTLVFTSQKAQSVPNLEYITIDFKNDCLTQILSHLYERKLLSVIVEGGSALLNSFIKEKLWDEARVFTGNKFFGDGTKAPDFKYIPIQEEVFGNSILRYYRS